MRKTESLSVGLSGGRPLRMADRSLRRLAVFLVAFVGAYMSMNLMGRVSWEA